MNKLYSSGVYASVVIIAVWNILIFFPSSYFSFIATDKLVTIFVCLISIALNFNTFKIERFDINKNKLIGIFFTVITVILALNIVYFINKHGYYFITDLAFYIPLLIFTLLIFEGFSTTTYLEKLGLNILENNNDEVEWTYFIYSIMLKVFFACFLFDMIVIIVDSLISVDVLSQLTIDWFKLIYQLGLMIDVGIAIVGYTFSAKYFKNSIKSFNKYFSAILVCFLCYPPLNHLLSDFIKAPDTFIWSNWLDKNSIFYWIWGSLLVLTWGIYWWSTIAFGNTFSNLTYRRLIYWGPYKYCAHPAYLAKNIYWWLLSVPFVITTSLCDTFIAVLVVLFWNGIYYLRAKTEELHLSQYPAYRRYLKMVPLKCF